MNYSTTLDNYDTWIKNRIDVHLEKMIIFNSKRHFEIFPKYSKYEFIRFLHSFGLDLIFYIRKYVSK